MDNSEKVKYWLDLADYDLGSAKVMLHGGKYLYVAFMCHQTIEKTLKAVIARDCAEGEIPPKKHDLSKLAIQAGIFDIMSKQQQDFIDYLNPLNIEIRYPEHRDQLLSAMTETKCNEIITGTEDLLCWIKKQL